MFAIFSWTYLLEFTGSPKTSSVDRKSTFFLSKLKQNSILLPKILIFKIKILYVTNFQNISSGSKLQRSGIGDHSKKRGYAERPKYYKE